MGKKRGPTKNTDKPHGQFGLFLASELERHEWSVEEFRKKLASASLEKDGDTIRTWLNGSNGPRLSEMGEIATALGYKSWLDMVAAVFPTLPRKKRK